MTWDQKAPESTDDPLPPPLSPAARFLQLLASARPADARAVAAALPAEELAGAVDSLRGRISLPVRDYILTEGPGIVLAALARHAVRGRGEQPDDAVDRILLRCDPVADAAFFDGEFAAGRIERARRLVLCDRKGPDGRAVIPPQVKRLLLDALAQSPEADKRLLEEMSAADDADLALALVPYAKQLIRPQAAKVIMTLIAHGHRREAKRNRALWSGRGRDFAFLGLPRFGRMKRKYASRTFHALTIRDDLKPVGVAEYQAFAKSTEHPDPVAYSRMLAMARTALRAGTMSAAEVLEHTRPAALATMLTEHDPTGDWQPGLRRAADDVRALISRDASERLGGDPQRWARVITRVNTYRHTLPELLADPDPDADHKHWSSAGHDANFLRIQNSISDVYAANVILALAPRDIADRALRTRRMKRPITTAAAMSPLCHALTEYIITRGTTPQREELAANEFTPDSVLARLIEKTQQTEVLVAILDRDLVGPEIVTSVFKAVRRDRALREWLVESAPYDPAMVLDALRHMADDPAWVLRMLRAAAKEFDEPGRIAGYVLLAEIAGVEIVWAMEQDRAGTLEKMAPYVRASMATGDAEPLIQAMRDFPIEERPAVPFAELRRNDEALGRRLVLPLEDLIRSYLDGHVDRWLRLAELMAVRPEASDEELIAEVAAPA